LKDNIFNDKQNDSFSNSPRDLYASNVIDVTTVQDVTAITDASYVLSATSDISQVTTTGEVLMVHHNMDTEYDANDPVLILSSSTSSPRTLPSKPPYPIECHLMKLQGMSTCDFIQAHVHELETEAVPEFQMIPSLMIH
jgi:hypothetical protein